MRRAVLILATLSALLLALAQPASAATGTPPMRESGTITYASGSTSECEEQAGSTICTDTSLNVVQTPEGETACLDIQTYSISASGRMRVISSEGGCTELAPGTLTVSGDSVTLAPTAIQLYSCNRRTCTPSDVVTVSGTFSGTGEVTTYSGRGSFTEGGCRYQYSYRGESQQALVELTVDGSTTTGEGMINEERYSFSTTC